MGRLEMRASEDLIERIDRARGDTPRATWVKARLEEALCASGGSEQDSVPRAASPRAGLEAARAAVASTAPSWSRLSRDPEESEPFYDDLPPEERVA